GGGSGRSREVGLSSNIPSVTTEDVGPPEENKRVGGMLFVNERHFRTPNSEAEAFRDGRTEEVDRDTRSRAFSWCRDFLAGSWKTVEERDFQISIVIICSTCVVCLTMCPLSQMNLASCSSYGAILQGVDSLVLESVMFAILAERTLGPKLYGIFPQGRLEQYFPNTRMRTDQLPDPAISAEIATKVACFHEMSMPFNKEPSWLFGTIDKPPDEINITNTQTNVIAFTSLIARRKILLLWKSPLPPSFKMWLSDTMSLLNALLAETKSPVVFCHNDVTEGNILILEDKDPNTTDRLMLIDFEYSSYNYRGFDFGNHFCEWMYDYTYN
ncbi:hypothetical protein F7725_004308, partial [Dissostichus mawsoni]